MAEIKGFIEKYLPFFKVDEIKGFIKKYIGKEFFVSINDPSGRTREITADDGVPLSDLSERIFEETRGHPIMVKFSLLGDGLRTDQGLFLRNSIVE